FFMLQIIKKLVDVDKNYKLYIAGEFKDPLIKQYWDYQINEMQLQNNIVFEGWQSDVNRWLENKNFILAPSIHESFGFYIAEAMACGIKPIIHNFLYAKEIWPKEYLFNTIDEAVEMITCNNYPSNEYRAFIENNYSLMKELKLIKETLADTVESQHKRKIFDYKTYWNNRLNSNFNLTGVGHIELGEDYNIYLYKSRFTILKYFINKLFGNLAAKDILEIGPGIGVFTDFFNKVNVGSYLGIDISEKSVTYLSNKYKHFSFVKDDISSFRDKTQNYDLIFGADVLLHLTDEERYIATMKNLCAQLKDTGYIILFDQISTNPQKSSVPHVVIRDINYIKKLVENIGYEIEAILPSTFFMNSPFDITAVPNISEINQVFNNILYCMKNELIKDKQTRLFVEYLYLLDKLCLLKYITGPSQKAVVIKKKDNVKKLNFSINEIWHENILKDKLLQLNNSGEYKELLRENKEVNKIINSIDLLLK
ncbi:glycosyltransferase, partial [Bacillaceae bacterium Marseille-Q3522]|nr:glycosyltransferase [Bacillaceae bacterium Marseille-Q3522]